MGTSLGGGAEELDVTFNSYKGLLGIDDSGDDLFSWMSLMPAKLWSLRNSLPLPPQSKTMSVETVDAVSTFTEADTTADSKNHSINSEDDDYYPGEGEILAARGEILPSELKSIRHQGDKFKQLLHDGARCGISSSNMTASSQKKYSAKCNTEILPVSIKWSSESKTYIAENVCKEHAVMKCHSDSFMVLKNRKSGTSKLQCLAAGTDYNDTVIELAKQMGSHSLGYLLQRDKHLEESLAETPWHTAKDSECAILRPDSFILVDISSSDFLTPPRQDKGCKKFEECIQHPAKSGNSTLSVFESSPVVLKRKSSPTAEDSSSFSSSGYSSFCSNCSIPVPEKSPSPTLEDGTSSPKFSVATKMDSTAWESVKDSDTSPIMELEKVNDETKIQNVKSNFEPSNECQAYFKNRTSHSGTGDKDAISIFQTERSPFVEWKYPSFIVTAPPQIQVKRDSVAVSNTSVAEQTINSTQASISDVAVSSEVPSNNKSVQSSSMASITTTITSDDTVKISPAIVEWGCKVGSTNSTPADTTKADKRLFAFSVSDILVNDSSLLQLSSSISNFDDYVKISPSSLSVEPENSASFLTVNTSPSVLSSALENSVFSSIGSCDVVNTVPATMEWENGIFPNRIHSCPPAEVKTTGTLRPVEKMNTTSPPVDFNFSISHLLVDCQVSVSDSASSMLISSEISSFFSDLEVNHSLLDLSQITDPLEEYASLPSFPSQSSPTEDSSVEAFFTTDSQSSPIEDSSAEEFFTESQRSPIEDSSAEEFFTESPIENSTVEEFLTPGKHRPTIIATPPNSPLFEQPSLTFSYSDLEMQARFSPSLEPSASLQDLKARVESLLTKNTEVGVEEKMVTTPVCRYGVFPHVTARPQPAPDSFEVQISNSDLLEYHEYRQTWPNSPCEQHSASLLNQEVASYPMNFDVQNLILTPYDNFPVETPLSTPLFDFSKTCSSSEVLVGGESTMSPIVQLSASLESVGSLPQSFASEQEYSNRSIRQELKYYSNSISSGYPYFERSIVGSQSGTSLCVYSLSSYSTASLYTLSTKKLVSGGTPTQIMETSAVMDSVKLGKGKPKKKKKKKSSVCQIIKKTLSLVKKLIKKLP